MNNYEIETYFYGFLKQEVLKDYKICINEMLESKYVKVKLKEFYMDDKNMYFNIRFFNFNNKKVNLANAKIYINSEKINFNAMCGGYGSSLQYGEDFVDMLLSYNIENLELGDILDIKFNVYAIGYLDEEEDQRYLEGEWNFKFTFNRKKVLDSIRTISINRTINLYGKNIKIYNMKRTPLGVNLSHEYLGCSEEYKQIGILDENEKLLSLHGGHGNSGKNIQENEFIIDTRNLTKIKMVPYKLNRETMEDEVDIENSIVIDLD